MQGKNGDAQFTLYTVQGNNIEIHILQGNNGGIKVNNGGTKIKVYWVKMELYNVWKT